MKRGFHLELDTVRTVGDESLQHSNKCCHNVLSRSAPVSNVKYEVSDESNSPQT